MILLVFCLCVSVCVSLEVESDFSETIKKIIIKLGTVTASDMRMQSFVQCIDLDLHSRSHKS